MASLMRKM